MPPQNSTAVPLPLSSGALDKPNASQNPASANNNLPVQIESQDTTDLFPLLSKSKGFTEAMAKADKSGSIDPATTLPPAMIMQRHLRTMENSDLYKDASAKDRIRYQAAFYKKYVVPAQKAANYKGSFQEWINDRGTYWQYKANPDKAQGSGFIPETIKTAPGIISAGVADTTLRTHKEILARARDAQEKFINVSKDLSLGSAMLNATIAPHMGPIIMDPEYIKVRESKHEQKIDDYINASENFGVNGFKHTLTNKLLYEGGKLGAQAPAFMVSGGLLGDVVKLPEILNLEKATGVTKLASRSIYNAAQGYLVGGVSGENPIKSAIGFGVGTIIFSPVETLFGKVWGWGGGKLTTALMDAAIKSHAEDAAESKVSSVATSLAGSQKQKINAAVIAGLNELSGGNFYKAPDAAKKIALSKLAAKAPQFADQISFIDKTIVGVDAARNLVRQREAVPELNNVLSQLEKISKQPTHESVADAVQKKTEFEDFVKSPEKAIDKLYDREMLDPDTGRLVAPGAAKAKSLEFGDNLTKHVDSQLAKVGLGKDRIQFESRGHKFLFYLNTLMSDQQRLGASKERNLEFNALLNKLHEEFPKSTLPELIKKSDKIWSDVEQASKAGLMKEGEVFRYWRNHSSPGESPLAHEVQLLQKAQQADAALEESAKKVTQEGKGPMAVKDIPSPVPTFKKMLGMETEEEVLNRKMKEATQKVSGKDTGKLEAATEQLFSGRKFNDLSGEERIQAVNISLGKDRYFGLKGKK